MTPAARAREQAGFSIEQAAARAYICVPYLKRVERHGGASYALAMRLARLYRCSANLFLYSQGSETPERNVTSGRPSQNV